MNKTDLFKIGDAYGQMLNKVKVVNESKKGPGDQELNKGAKLQKGGPDEKGGYSKKRLTGRDDDAFDSSKFTYADDDDKAPEEDEELMVEAVQHINSTFGKNRQSADVIKMIVEMGKVSISRLRTVIHNLNEHNSFATRKMLVSIMGSKDPLLQECKTILRKVIAYDKQKKGLLMENKKRKKVRRKSINKGRMKKTTKTSFDKLFESVMGDEPDELNELGVDQDTGLEDDYDDLGDDLESDVDDLGEEVTVTLDRATAEALIDTLQAALGDVEDIEDVDDFEDDDLGDFDEDEDLDDFEEDEEGLATGTGIPGAAGVPKQSKTNVNYGKKNQVSRLKPSRGNVATGTGIPGEAGVPKQSSTNINYGKKNQVGNLKSGRRMFD